MLKDKKGNEFGVRIDVTKPSCIQEYYKERKNDREMKKVPTKTSPDREKLEWIARKGFQGISDIVAKGDYLAKLPDQTGGRKIGQHAKQKLIESVAPASYGRSQLPQKGIEVTGKKGDFSIDWTPYKLDISWGAMQRPVITLDPKGSVNVELAQRASVECNVVTMTIPKEIGNLVDTSA